MIINRFNRFLRVEATGQSDYAGESLSERMAGKDFTFTPPGQAPATPDPAPADPPAPAAPVPVSQAAPVDPPAPPADDADDDLDELPTFGAKTPVAPKPADLDFDAQTDAIVAAITAKGHPGDEYKRLRAELKSLKEKPQVPDLDQIPEVQTLRQKAAEADRLKGEAEALRQRNKELLQVNNEVEVKESDEFIQGVTEPIKNIETMVGQIAATSEINAGDIFAVITEADIIKQDRMLEQLHQKLGSRTAGRIERFCDDYKAATAKGHAMLAKSGENAEKSRLARENTQREEIGRRESLFKASVESSFTQYAKSVPGFTDSSGNLTDIAQAAMHAATTVDISTLGPDDIGYLAFTANALPAARRAIAELRKENAILKGTRKAPAPLAGQPAPAPAKDDEFMGLSDRMKGMEFTFTPPT